MPIPDNTMLRVSAVRRGRFGLRGVLAFASALLAFLAPARAQTAGSLTGTVLDAATGKFLEGATVSVEGTNIETTTEREGRFVLRDVPAGAHNVVVSYPGLETNTSSVTFGASTAPLNVRLGSGDVIKLSGVTVAGTKEGMAQAIALQRVAPNMKVVAASDQYGDISEGNAAEYLKFLPGVGIDYNANDARAATLRGMSTQFTNVLMDGDPIASATSGNLNRRFEFEQVAINNVETIEVVKTLTPDVMATSTGGNINLVSKSAFDHEGSLLTYRAYYQAINDDLYLRKSEGWGQEMTRKILPGVDINYSFRPRENVGLTFSYKNSQLFNDYPRSSYTWEYNPANGGLPTKPALTSWNLQNEQKDTRRQGASSRLDYKFDEHTRLSLLADWTFYDLLFTDRTTTVNTGNLTPLATTSTPAYGNGTVTGLPGKGSVTFQTINRWKSGVTWDFPLNFSHDFDNGSKLNASAYWSQAYSKYRDTTGDWYSDMTVSRTGLNVTFNNVAGIVPSYTVTDSTGAAVDLRDLSKFSITQIRSRPQTGVDTRSGGSLDYKFDTKLTVPTAVTLGLRDDISTRNISNPVFNRTAFTTPITGSQLAALADTGFSSHSIGYGLPAYNFPSVYRAFDQLGGLGVLPYTPASDTQARFEDTTKAGYARFDVKPVENLLVVAGVRYEDRVTDSTNRLTTLPAPVSAKFTDKSWFPSVNFKYDLTHNIVLRAGFSKTIGLPDYSDLLPTLSVTDPTSSKPRGTLNVYNAGLQAYRVNNFDAGIEYYFNRSGYVAASVFRKDLKNFIATVGQALTPALAAQLGVPLTSLGAPPDQYDVTYRLNVPETGHYTGLEVGFSQNFTFLPKPFNTLGLQVNGTLLSIDPMNSSAVFSSTDTALNTTLGEQIKKNLELSAVKQALNVTLNYSYGRWGFNVVTNYTGHVLKTISQKTVKFSDVAANQYYNEYQYQAPRETVDVRIDYKWDRRFTPYFQARNIFGRPIVMSTPILPFNHAEYGDPIYELGLRGTW
ncbi:MAG TPA: TonB-dependent receptor [Opitutaceae bacterium]|nr:TonB-dependent receptor [Opitutaceae bacterium]